MNLLNLKKINLLFIFIIIILALIGTAALYSAGEAEFDLWAKKHIIRFFVFLIIIFLIASIDIKIFYKYAYFLFFMSLLLLLSVEIIGTLGKGAERWINIFGFSVQPSELIKINIILALAKFYNDLRFDRIGKIRNTFFPLLFIFVPTSLIALQPDLGTAVTIILLGLFIMFQSGVRIWKFFLAGIVTLFSFPFLWQSIKPYQQKRILSFLNPESDPLGQGYQLIQSKIALGSGALQGKGFLGGTQSYLQYLPEKQTDFIFTLIGEEFGFIGVSFILLLFFILILIAYFISIKSRHIFGRILAIGVATNLFLYVVLNTAMVSGLLPVVGIPLPLISYGGTAMLSIMISFGLLLNVEINANNTSLNK
ncbi:MAG: Rod shape-determining protein RodA [Alphaproteobacteria bacterium MarineAlpha5_Bin8]|nr:MAG: Rod shape-determining protein RodA [Alphaproteobacteria bacterium MarineAlpha5_Bin7]PPR48225.1 MAG: Rod shape-determining protein RodA [Alphaproteobacteria bacterium MarineAlpha5_Bin8]|tara:strand:- start:1430 stop:2527 length:1098 start_codon:yes stop_codon:yes gene_type:complete